MPDSASGSGSSGATPLPADTDEVRSISRRVRDITRENERLFSELLAGERRLRRLAKSVWRVQEEERRRLARELHDGIGQTLTALKNQLEMTRQHLAAEGGPLAGDLAESLELASQALEETRELSRLLRPPVLDDLGLEAALGWLGRTIAKRARIGVEVEVDSGGRVARLEPEIETLVFRVVQEALTNVVKHSGAASARVRLEVGRRRLVLTVSDDGEGLDAEKILADPDDATGVGLRGIHDRAELHGGRFRLRSVPGEGTELEVAVPIAAEEER